MQDSDKILPRFINTDVAYEHLNNDESPFIKGLAVGMNANPELGNGTNNPTGEGQNVLVLTPTRSNKVVPNAQLPKGINKNVFSFESVTTQEFYYGNHNSNGNHGIYVISGNSGKWTKVIEDIKLNFSDKPEHYISHHRVRIRVRLDEKKNIIEKYLTWTDGNVWQGWINVIACAETNGFDVSLYPYWALQPPHFDREELLQYAVRPPMYTPVVSKLENTAADLGNINRILDNAFQFCDQFIYTDGRQTTTSPYSVPSIVKTTDFLSNPDLLPKKFQLELYAGSCMVECVNIFFRKTVYRKNEAGSDLLTWSDWYLYDTIYKYNNCGVNSPSVIGNKYWLRKNAWDGFNYDPVKNTIKYIFDNSKTAQITPQELFERFQDMPQVSVAMSDLGDSIVLANNREGYDNLPCEVTDKLSVSVENKSVDTCTLPFRKIRLYVYVGRERGNSSGTFKNRIRNVWHSQIGYYNGDDKTTRFGGTFFEQKDTSSDEIVAKVDINESKQFDLDFADKDGFRVYLKGTPYYADAKWYQVKNDFSLAKLTGLTDINNPSDIQAITTAYQGLSFFVGVFDLEVPAGRYIATLGRHNVENSGDYRNTSTYILGIANSRLAGEVIYDASLSSTSSSINATVKTVRPNAIVSNSKELELDCTNGDIDVWGNGKDLFYVVCPFDGIAVGKSKWTFIEGYLKEDKTTGIPVEQFPYDLTYSQGGATGIITDKNGFFWGYTWGKSSLNNEANPRFNAVVNCAFKTFGIPINSSGSDSAWRTNNVAYLVDYNGGIGNIGFANRVLLKGKITDLTNVIGYSNISVSIVDGQSTFTNNNGEFTLIIHNGKTTPRVSNVYINAAGSFLITLKDCGQLPLFSYNDALVPCQINSERRYADINQAIVVQGGDYQSLKANASYINGVVVADLAGRQSFLNKVTQNTVSSFLKRNNTLPTFFKWSLLGSLGLKGDKYKDFKWIGFYTTLASNYKKYTQWVGDKIEYIDENGNVTDTPSSASLVRITITSLLNANIQKNFTLLSTYQFAQNDRLRILDDGDNNLYDTSTYGEGINVEILGSNYNQAAINANLITPPNNTVLNNTSNVVGNSPTTLYVNYDSRFDKLKDKTGFWIELYTPTENNDKLPFFEITWYPVINGEIAEYVSGGASNPVYNYPQSGTLNYWDTYQIRRSISIPDVGNKFIQHIFESPNITDSWGNKVSSGGRPSAINPYAKQMWYIDSIIRSDDFISSGVINGLGTFRVENKKTFKGYQRGGIVFISCQFSVIFFGCENDFFVTDFNYNYIYANAQGVQIANLDKNLGEPHQKVGSNFGCSYDNTRTVIINDKEIYWYDKKNEAFVVSNYSSANDISDLTDKDGRKYGIKSYLIKKTQFITNWNNTHGKDSIFDVITGIDLVRKKIYLTFRPRRNNTNDIHSYVNEVRNIKLDYQETVVYDIETGRWIKFEEFTPEGYGNLRGNESGVEFITFAAGLPYKQNNTGKKITTVIEGECSCPEGYDKINNACIKSIPASLIADASTIRPVGGVYYAKFHRAVPLEKPIVNTYKVTYASSVANSSLPVTVTSTVVDGVEYFDLPYSVIYHVGISAVLGAGGYHYTGAYASPFSMAGYDFYYSTDNGVTYTKLTNVTNINPQLISYMLPVTSVTTNHVLLIKRKSDGFVDYGTFGSTLFLYPSIIDVLTTAIECQPNRTIVFDDGKVDFLKFYGVQTEPVLMASLNKGKGSVKILQSLRQDTIGENMYVDMIYNSQQNSFSYVPLNHWKEKEKNSYAAVLRDMVSYLEPNDQEKFRSSLQQGKRLFGEVFIIRFVGDYNNLGNYFQISEIGYLFTNSAPVKP